MTKLLIPQKALNVRQTIVLCLPDQSDYIKPRSKNEQVFSRHDDMIQHPDINQIQSLFDLRCQPWIANARASSPR